MYIQFLLNITTMCTKGGHCLGHVQGIPFAWTCVDSYKNVKCNPPPCARAHTHTHTHFEYAIQIDVLLMLVLISTPYINSNSAQK
jgi:hypothetical protein